MEEFSCSVVRKKGRVLVVVRAGGGEVCALLLEDGSWVSESGCMVAGRLKPEALCSALMAVAAAGGAGALRAVCKCRGSLLEAALAKGVLNCLSRFEEALESQRGRMP